MSQQNQQFGALRSLLFPVHTHELKRFIPMALMMLLILFNYTVLRNIKDSLVINAKGSDAEIISFLKLWGTTPVAILFMVLYAKLSNNFNKRSIFYMCLIPFILFFTSFAFIIYPNFSALHPDPAYVASLKEELPRLKWFITMGANWSYSLFYILAELWGSVMLSLLFWQFANDTTSREDAKRFYPLFGLFANIGLIGAGASVSYFANYGKMAPVGVDPWQVTLTYMMSFIAISGVGIGILYYFLSQKSAAAEKIEAATPKKSKPKMSVGESFKYLLTSPHLICIAILVFCYGITINFIDVLWKGQVKIHTAGDYNAFASYMADFSMMTGFIAIPLMLLGGNLLRRLTWFQSATIVPAMLFVTGLAFFGMVFYGTLFDAKAELFTFMGTTFTPVALAVNFGYWQNAFTKASKYSLFDPTKEMAYIPLDDELRSKGKAAVDVAGGRTGKSGGSLTFVILQTLLPAASLTALTPYLGVVFIAIMLLWFGALIKLNRSLLTLEGKKEEKETLEEAVAA
jgi:AAA family ATP:ADP antiporter